MPLPSKFAAKPAGAKPAAGKTQIKPSRFGTFTPREEGPPMLECMLNGAPAIYRVRFESAEECLAQKPGGQNTIKSYCVVESGDGPTPAETRVLVLHMQSQYGRADFNDQCVNTAGYDSAIAEDVEAFVTFDPRGDFFAACVGDANEYAEHAAGMVGRLVDVQVSRGKDDGKGGYYRKYKWAPVAEEEQDQAPKIEAAAE